MKTTKAGIIIYEDSDPVPDAERFTDQLAIMINSLRKEINKMAVIIDRQQEEIDKLKQCIRTDSVPDQYRDPFADTLAKAVGTWIDGATSVLSDERPYIIKDSVPDSDKKE